jgi:HAMP domain-containing protein
MQHQRIAARLRSVRRDAAARAASLCNTIRGRILIAFLIMTVITGALGIYATFGIKHAGILVDKTFDESLMSINYARAAAADFAGMRATFTRQWIATDPQMRAELGKQIGKLGASLAEDLQIASERSQSLRAVRAAENVRRAAEDWKNMSERLIEGVAADVNWETLDHYAVNVDEQIDLLVNYTAGDGFLYRQNARGTVARDIQFNLAGIVLALLLSGAVAWALARRIVGPVAVASGVAERIAAGKLDVAVPRGSADELGAIGASWKFSSCRPIRSNPVSATRKCWRSASACTTIPARRSSNCWMNRPSSSGSGPPSRIFMSSIMDAWWPVCIARLRTAAGSRPMKMSPSVAKPKPRSFIWRGTTRSPICPIACCSRTRWRKR